MSHTRVPTPSLPPVSVIPVPTLGTPSGISEDALLKAGALQTAILNSSNFSSIATDANGVIQIFNVGAERMLGYSAIDVINKLTPADISDPQELIARSESLSAELDTPIAPGFEALVFKASRGIEDIYELTYIRKDGTRFPAVVSVTALRDLENVVIGYLLIGTDNTARKQAEIALRESDAKFRTMVEAVPTIVWITRADGWNIYFSQKWMDYTGLTLEESLGHGWNKPFHPDDRQAAWDAWKQAVSTVDGDYRIESRLRRADGVYRWWLLMGVRQLDSDGTTVKWFGTCTDIHEHKEAEAELRASDEKLRLLVAGVKDHAIFMLDPDGVVSTWNDGAEAIKGYRAEDILGRHLRTFYTPEQIALGEPERQLSIAANKGHFEEEGLRVRKDGSAFMADIVMTALRDEPGKLLGFSKVTRDITARKQAEADTTALLRTIHLHSIVSVADRAGKIIEVNDSFCKISGYSREELIGRTHQIVNSGTHSPEFWSEMWRSISNGRSWRGEICNRRKDGALYWVDSIIAPFSGDDGKTVKFISIRTDITAAKLSEVKLREANQSIALATDIAGIGIWEVEAESRKLKWSARMFQIYGLPESAEPPTAEERMRTTHPDDIQLRLNAFAMMAAGEPLSLEYRHFHPDGEMHWVEVTGGGVHGGGPARYTGAARDITAAKLWEGKLRDANRRIALATEGGGIGIWELEIPLGNRTWSPKMFEIFGLTDDGSPPTSEQVERSCHPEDRALVQEQYTTMATGRPFHVEFRSVRPDGEVRWIETSGNRMIDDTTATPHYIGVARDITERKRAEEALREGEKQFQTVVNAIPQLAWTAQADGSILWYNQRWFDYTGTTLEQMEGWGWQRVHDPELLPKVMEAWKLSIGNGQPFEMEFPLRAADGHYGWFLTRVFPLKDDAGNVLRWFGTNTDLSQKRAADKEIRELNANLEQRVVERTAELEAANKELEAFSYSVSHDLRAPLRAVDGFSQAVLEDYGGQLPEEGRRDLQTIRDGAQRMGVLIDDLLKFSRLSRTPLNKQQVNTGKLVGNVLESLDSQREGRQVDIRVGELPECQGDAGLLNQVWVNLISNALKYTRRRETAAIEIGCKFEHDENVYFVRDNGAGFNMRYVDKLFGVFQRLHRADEFEGTGVGLAIVQRIIHRHGGRIWADAALNQGATFSFTLKEKAI